MRPDTKSSSENTLRESFSEIAEFMNDSTQGPPVPGASRPLKPFDGHSISS